MAYGGFSAYITIFEGDTVAVGIFYCLSAWAAAAGLGRMLLVSCLCYCGCVASEMSDGHPEGADQSGKMGRARRETWQGFLPLPFSKPANQLLCNRSGAGNLTFSKPARVITARAVGPGVTLVPSQLATYLLVYGALLTRDITTSLLCVCV